MAAEISTCIPDPGFKFDNCIRNKYLESKGVKVNKVTKTGTTITGITFKDGVILGADTRATSGDIVQDKVCSKIHYVAPNIYCLGAGTAADTEQVTRMVSSQATLHRLSTGRPVPVSMVVCMLSQHLFRYNGYVRADLIVGGVDSTGAHLYTIAHHGSIHHLDYGSNGSGTLAATSVLERDWKKDMELKDGQALICNAIRAGIFNDLGSGSQVDMCVITKDGAKIMRPYEISNVKGEFKKFKYRPGTTAVLTKEIVPLEIVETVVQEEKMDTED